MTYAQPSDLLSRFGAAEIAQRVDRGMPRLITLELLEAAVAGGDLSAFPQPAQDRVAKALVKMQSVLVDATDTINSYVSSRYTLPLSTVPAVLVRLASDLARYYLYDDQVTENIQKRFEAAIKMLQDVARGTIQLGVESQSGQAPVSEAGAELVSGERVWDRTRSQGFM